MRKHTILFLAANPLGTNRLALDREARSIHVELERSRWRDRFEFVTRWAAEPLDLVRELHRLQPTVVQFSGHGGNGTARALQLRVHRDVVDDFSADDDSECRGLFFQDADGAARRVSAAALRDTFGAAGSSVKLVVLNACYSESTADALLVHVDCVVGMTGSIRDEAARSFAIGFYSGLGECASVEAAYRGGCAAIRLEGCADGDRPRLKVRRGVDPSTLVLATLTMAGSSPLATDGQHVSIGRDAVANVIAMGNKNAVEVHVATAKHQRPLGDPANVDVAKELAAIRAILMSLGSEHARKIGRALDDANEEARKNSSADKYELGRALQCALVYAKSASAFPTTTTKLAPHVRNAVEWLGDEWSALLTYLA